MGDYGIGQSVPREEDPYLLRGAGRYVDDVSAAGQLRAFVLRPWIDIEPYGRLPGHGWLTDLLRADPVAADVLEVRARPDLAIESGR